MEHLFGTKKIQIKMITLYIYAFFIFFNCQNKKNESHAKYYKYFDEYKMEGFCKINDIEDYKGKYFVSVISTNDSIFLSKMNKCEVIEKVVYLRKKGNWEVSFKEKELEGGKTFKYLTFHHKKIISNDTIYKYNYNLIKGKYAGGCLAYSTKQKSFFCHDCEIDDIRNNFNIESAKKFIKECNSKEIFSKKYIKERMFVYYEDGTLSDVRSFNFGYFDSDENLNESFIDEYQK